MLDHEHEGSNGIRIGEGEKTNVMRTIWMSKHTHSDCVVREPYPQTSHAEKQNKNQPKQIQIHIKAEIT